MAKRLGRKKRGFKFTKKKVGIPQAKTGQDILNNPCDLCEGTVIYTTNDVLYNVKRGLGYIYYCTDCRASVSCHNRKEKLDSGEMVYEPKGILGDKESMQLRVLCHQILDDSWRIRQTMKRSTAYHKLAVGMGIPYENCHFAWMNKEQLRYAVDVLTMTAWTKNMFD